MTQARHTQVSLEDTRYYHCISRCVRRAYLCGQDHYSGKNFEHRRVWLVERLRLLSQVFAIDICAYSIMSNHYHLVLHIDEKQAKAWTHQEIVTRWATLHHTPPLIVRWQKNELTCDAEIDKTIEIIEQWRKRLMSLSWFMRNMNEYIARQANQEDQCTGRFWEGRFKSQALLSERALLSCMAYVDLNPIRATMVDSLENSEYTSIFERIHGHTCQDDTGQGQCKQLPQKSLLGFVGNQRQHQPQKGLEYSLLDYLELVEPLGQTIRPDKRGFIVSTENSLLQKLELDEDQWLTLSEQFGRHFRQAVGDTQQLRHYASHTHRAWVRQHSTRQKHVVDNA